MQYPIYLYVILIKDKTKITQTRKLIQLRVGHADGGVRADDGNVSLSKGVFHENEVYR